MEEETETNHKPKRQKLITKYRSEKENQVGNLTDNQGPPDDDSAEQDLEVRDLQRQLQDEEMMMRGKKAMLRSLRQRQEAQRKYNLSVQLLSTGGEQEDK